MKCILNSLFKNPIKSLFILIFTIILAIIILPCFLILLIINIYEEIRFSFLDKNTEVYITSWAKKGTKANLDEERWVMIGKPSRLNYIGTGLFGGDCSKEEGLIIKDYPFKNSICEKKPLYQIIKPSGSLEDGFLKRILRQRKYDPKKNQ